VLFSYHGLPELHITKADPTGQHCLKSATCCQTPSPAHATCYRHQVLRTTEEFVKRAGLRPDQYSIAFQSRLGRAKWLEPSTETTLKELAGNGVKKLLVLCPAFVTDCLETLEEIEIQGTATFKGAGGESLTLIPCLNAHPQWVSTLARWIA
jgi:ferrochelatase